MRLTVFGSFKGPILKRFFPFVLSNNGVGAAAGLGFRWRSRNCCCCGAPIFFSLGGARRVRYNRGLFFFGGRSNVTVGPDGLGRARRTAVACFGGWCCRLRVLRIAKHDIQLAVSAAAGQNAAAHSTAEHSKSVRMPNTRLLL